MAIVLLFREGKPECSRHLYAEFCVWHHSDIPAYNG